MTTSRARWALRTALRTALRMALVASGIALVIGGGWALAASVSSAGDPRAPHVHGVPIGLLGTGAIILGGLFLALYVVMRRPA